ncbi:MAG: DUF350 domain-containing protein [SAR324 cluster bacterium]|nr:DUF350 domain-containing protein [SAR324 cluster bacterium]
MLDTFMIGLTHVVIYFVIGLMALMLGRKFFDWMSSYDLTHETSENDNNAVAFAEAGFYIGIAIIIHASVEGEINYDLFPFLNEENPGLWKVLGAELIMTTLYFLIGLVCLGFGRKGIHKIMPYDMDKEIIEDRNVGVGVLEACFYISVAIIIHGILI